jgi:hypothetical protein
MAHVECVPVASWPGNAIQRQRWAKNSLSLSILRQERLVFESCRKNRERTPGCWFVGSTAGEKARCFLPTYAQLPLFSRQYDNSLI